MSVSYLQAYFSRYPHPAEAQTALLEAAADAKVLNAVQCAADAYGAMENCNEGAILSLLEAARKQADAPSPSYALDYLFYVFCMGHLERRYAEAGLPQRWLDGVAADLLAKLHECHTIHGVWGTYVFHWFPWFFTLQRFAMGRLQFEFRPMHSCVSPDGSLMFCGEPSVNVHIPSGAPLDPDAVEASFQEAAAFYAERFPDRRVLFTCSSWLLFPGHRQMLPPESRIRQFMDFFTPVSGTIDNGKRNLWRIFGTEQVSDLDALPEKTGLQRAYLRWLRSGKPVGNGIGIRYIQK